MINPPTNPTRATSLAPAAPSRLAAAWIVGLLTLSCASAGPNNAVLPFRIPAGPASKTLKQFAEQAQREILFPSEPVADERTPPLFGNYAPREALNRLLSGTRLHALEAADTGGFVIATVVAPPTNANDLISSASNPIHPMKFKKTTALLFTAILGSSSAFAQAVSVDPSAAQLANYDTTRSGALDPNEFETKRLAESKADPIMLSPFEVTSETIGYFQANTMSGTRLNSKIEDLGQSITVMTKEQMSDFAMLDVNDVFDHMAGTEGTSSYSLYVTDRTGAMIDQVSFNPNNANRVRGIGSANIAFGNIATTGRVPVDPLWMDSLELSRGPNANIFGLGKASGSVNQVAATANLTRDFTKMDLRGDSYDGYRGSLDVNRMIIDKKLAVRASVAYQHIGFTRKPSGEDSRRLSFQVKAQPFKNTKVSASWYSYKNDATRPNFTTPRDHYTDWRAAGQPGWNPATRLVTLANGQIYGNGNVLGSTTPYTGTPSFFTGGTSLQSMFQIGGPGEAPYWGRTRFTSGATATTDPLAAAATGLGLMSTGPSESYTANQQPLYNNLVKPINDRSIYDWTEINLNSTGKATDDVNIYLVQLDQIILNSSKQTLGAQVTFMREDAKRLEDLPLGPASVNRNSGDFQVDVNTHYLDGTPNPYFGRPYLRASRPTVRDTPLLWDTFQAQAVYRFDFSQDPGWSKWLGSQQLLGYYENKEQQNRRYSYRRTSLGTNLPWQQKYAALNAPLGNAQNGNTDRRYLTANGTNHVSAYGQLNEQYYVGSTLGGGIEYGPSSFPEGISLPYVWGPSSGTMFRDVVAIGRTPNPDKGGGGNNLNSVVSTVGGVLQSTFLDSKLIGTFGLRRDKVKERNAPLALLTPDLREYDFTASNRWNSGWRLAEGDTKSVSIVVSPFRDLHFLRSEIEGGSGISRFLAEAVSGLRLTYNKSDNFIAKGPAYDLALNKLPNQTGISEDLGFWLSLLDGKLSLRYTNFDTKELDLRNGDITVMAQRVLRYEGFVANDRWNLRSQTSNWLNGVGTGGSASDEQIAAAIQMPLELYKGLQAIAANNTAAAVNDAQAKGHEVEINYNPSRHWTINASFTKTQSIITGSGAAVDDYIAARLPIWTTLEDPRFTQTTQTIGGVTTPISNTLPVGATGRLLWWNLRGQPFANVAGYDPNRSASSRFAENVDAPMSVFRALVGRSQPQVREYSVKINTRYNLAGISDHAILKKMSVGGSWRYASKGAIGYYGLGYTEGMDLRLPENKILVLDTNRPIWSPAETYVDLFVSYRTNLFSDRVGARLQLNVRNVGESGGGLQPTSAFFDGRPSTYRIVDPRQFILSASFDL